MFQPLQTKKPGLGGGGVGTRTRVWRGSGKTVLGLGLGGRRRRSSSPAVGWCPVYRAGERSGAASGSAYGPVECVDGRAGGQTVFSSSPSRPSPP